MITGSLDHIQTSMTEISLCSLLKAFPVPDSREVAGLFPAWPATFFRGDLIMKYFLWSFSPFC